MKDSTVFSSIANSSLLEEVTVEQLMLWYEEGSPISRNGNFFL
ncbi:hypothetical protein [Virgibacillus salexigens]|uniref:Uncharacterized protein n=1 Tax=Virgibacillus kapii TaxID=1638645 RepID=A0ABQ2DTB8_9BACI|nr:MULTISPECIES: hypothetical protein [Virgibacillus]GGJ72012.1 hypothetical protein GCM10007111_36960 [Virgibacillus kapii]